MDLEQTLTSRDQINGQLRGVLDEATGKWGIRVNRVELKAIDPPASVQESMEKQMRAEREKRAAILTAEGFKQSQILTAEGEKTSAILRAEGDAQSQILRAEGEAQAIQKVFDAIHAGNPDEKVLAYQYLQQLPSIANGTANKVWILPTELTKALEGLGSSVHEIAGIPKHTGGVKHRVDMGSTEPAVPTDPTLSKTNEEVQKAIAAAQESSRTANAEPSSPPPPADPTGEAPPAQ